MLAANGALAGLGLGLLSTAAVSLSQNVADLPLAGVEVARLAFRMGVVVDRVSQNLEPRDPSSAPGSWAAVVPDIAVEDVQNELDAIHAAEVSSTCCYNSDILSRAPLHKNAWVNLAIRTHPALVKYSSAPGTAHRLPSAVRRRG